MKTFKTLSEDVQKNRYLTYAEAMRAYEEGVANGSIRVCEHCGSPNLAEVEKFGMSCVDCGGKTNGVSPRMAEDAPTNNAGSGNVAGLGVGPAGEPGVSPVYQRKRKQLEVTGPPVVDPRMFADKIFKRKP